MRKRRAQKESLPVSKQDCKILERFKKSIACNIGKLANFRLQIVRENKEIFFEGE